MRTEKIFQGYLPPTAPRRHRVTRTTAKATARARR